MHCKMLVLVCDKEAVSIKCNPRVVGRAEVEMNVLLWVHRGGWGIWIS